MHSSDYINAKAREFQAADQPVISVDTKKKELIGEFKNTGSDYGPQGKLIEVDAHDLGQTLLQPATCPCPLN